MLTHAPVMCLRDGGASGAVLRDINWSANPLGPPHTWPQELQTVVGIALSSSQPMLIVWGSEQITLYNDGYARMCGERHPHALGKPFKDLWFDIWDQVEPIITAAYNGVSTSMDDIAFTMHRNGFPEETHFAFSYNPVRNRNGDVLGMLCPCTETTTAVVRHREQSKERDGFLQMFELALGAIALLSGPDHVFRYANADYLALVGQREVLGKSVREALPEIASQGFLELLDRVYLTGQPHVGRGVPVDLQRTPNGPVERRMIDLLYHAMRDSDGMVTGIFVQALDVTERIADEVRQQTLNRELVHRMRNQLAVIQAVVGQTLRSAPDLRAAADSLRGRISALSSAHQLLIDGEAEETTVHTIIREMRALHDDQYSSRFLVEGETLAVTESAALSLALILHELSTNAVKHGALSNLAGQVHINWGVEHGADGNQDFVLQWTEHDGPPVTPPARKGSGTRLIAAGLGGAGSSTVHVDYHTAGVRCTIRSKLAGVKAAERGLGHDGRQQP